LLSQFIALLQIQSVLSSDEQFDPATSERLFRLGMDDYTELVFLPGLLKRLEQQAPKVKLKSLLQIGCARPNYWIPMKLIWQLDTAHSGNPINDRHCMRKIRALQDEAILHEQADRAQYCCLASADVSKG